MNNSDWYFHIFCVNFQGEFSHVFNSFQISENWHIFILKILQNCHLTSLICETLTQELFASIFSLWQISLDSVPNAQVPHYIWWPDKFKLCQHCWQTGCKEALQTQYAQTKRGLAKFMSDWVSEWQTAKGSPRPALWVWLKYKYCFNRCNYWHFNVLNVLNIKY